MPCPELSLNCMLMSFGASPFIIFHAWIKMYRSLRLSNERGGPTTFLYMATRFLPNVHVQKCRKYVFSCLEVPWIDLLAVANLQWQVHHMGII